MLCHTPRRTPLFLLAPYFTTSASLLTATYRHAAVPSLVDAVTGPCAAPTPNVSSRDAAKYGAHPRSFSPLYTSRFWRLPVHIAIAPALAHEEPRPMVEAPLPTKQAHHTNQRAPLLTRTGIRRSTRASSAESRGDVSYAVVGPRNGRRESRVETASVGCRVVRHERSRRGDAHIERMHFMLIRYTRRLPRESADARTRWGGRIRTLHLREPSLGVVTHLRM
ncbi:hypothetical protein MVEN_00919300 [Mycena venus]|uniref:Secreted protein n=1 Tax=Mycena venus TaxID=2733690 RepID=A0A8H6YBG8_9AGAR|nr:hypothetical protein MVEN_00919300 [Mycena venus]